MRKLTTLLLTLSIFTCSVNAQITETATDAVKNMGLGWNLGNTLDAYTCATTDVTSDSYWGCQGLESETCWGQPKTTKGLITMMKNAGFGAVRVPVTWYPHMDKSGNVNAQWMARVKEVVDYVIDNGMYCILNVHHDTGADNSSFTSWIKADETYYTNNKTRYELLWKQIATEFKDYDNHLIFEAYNEMLDVKNSWCYASFNASGQYDATIATSAYNAINNYGQSFVNVVRQTGGNNTSRNLILNTYCAATGYGTWSSHLKEPVTKINLPEDSSAGHLIFEVHDYPNILTDNNTKERTLSDIKSEVDGTISFLNNNLVSKGAPVIIGEWGTSNVDAGDGKTDYDSHPDLMKQFAEYFVEKCKANNIATFYWMGLTDGSYRSIPAFNQPDLAECLAKAYHGSDYQGDYPDGSSDASSVTAFDGEKALAWGSALSIDSKTLQMVGYPLTVTITYKQTASGPDIQFWDGQWGNKITVIVDGKSYNGDFNPQSVYGTSAGTEHTTSITFDETTYNTLAQKGFLFQGTGVTIYKVVLTSDATTGIASVESADRKMTEAVYNLAGQRISKPSRGMYIKNGKVYMAR